jgi:hypothetical protein
LAEKLLAIGKIDEKNGAEARIKSSALVKYWPKTYFRQLFRPWQGKVATFFLFVLLGNSKGRKIGVLHPYTAATAPRVQWPSKWRRLQGRKLEPATKQMRKIIACFPKFEG